MSKPLYLEIKRGEKGIWGFLGFRDLSSGDEFGGHHTINSRVISTINLGCSWSVPCMYRRHFQNAPRVIEDQSWRFPARDLHDQLGCSWSVPCIPSSFPERFTSDRRSIVEISWRFSARDLHDQPGLLVERSIYVPSPLPERFTSDRA